MDASVAAEIAFAAGLSVKAAAVFGAGALLVLALGRASASLRHRAGTLVIWSAAALPLAALLLPGFELPILPAGAVSLRALASIGPLTPAPARRAADDMVASETMSPGAREFAPGRALTPSEAAKPGARGSSRDEAASAPSTSAQGARDASALMPLLTNPLANSSPSMVLAGRAKDASPWRLVVRARRALEALARPPALAYLLALGAGALWLLGAFLLWARLASGLSRVRRLAREGERADPLWEAMLAQAATRLGLDPARPVRLLVHPEVPVAMTAGARAPVVLLPRAAAGWSEERRRVVLLHELAHVRRGDWLQLVSSELALAVWWFHPLAWWLSRSVRRDAEQAADDLVLAAGTRPSDYAAHLLELVRGLRDREPAPRPAMAMAQLAGIEERVRSILDGRRRRSAGVLQSRALALGLCAAVLALAAARPTAAHARDESAAGLAGVDDVGIPNIGTPTIPPRAPPAPAAPPRSPPRPAPQPAPPLALADAPRAPPAPPAPPLPVPALAPLAPLPPGPPRGPMTARDLERLHDLERLRDLAREQGASRAELQRAQAEAQRARAVAEQALAQRESAEARRQAAEQVRLALADDRSHGGDGLDVKLDGTLDGEKINKTIELSMKKAGERLAAALGDRASRRRDDADDDEDDYERGLRLHHRGRYQEAIKAFEQAIDRDQRPDDASYNIACGYAQLGDAEHAAEWLKRAADEGFDVEGSVGSDDDFDPVRDAPPFRAAVQELRAQRGNRHAAEARALERRYQRLAKTNPKGAEPWYALGKELLDAGSYDFAVKSFQAAAERAQNPANALYNGACALALKGDKGPALDQLQRAIEGGFDDVHQLRSDDDLDALHDEPRFKELVQLARELELDVDRGSFELNLGSVHIWSRKSSKRRTADDLAHYQEMAKKHPDLGRAQYNLGYAQLAAEDAAGAEASFKKAASMGYRKGASLYNAACAEARAGHKDAAFESLQASLDAGFDVASAMSGDDDLEPLHGDARYRQFKREAGDQSDDEDDDE